MSLILQVTSNLHRDVQLPCPACWADVPISRDEDIIPGWQGWGLYLGWTGDIPPYPVSQGLHPRILEDVTLLVGHFPCQVLTMPGSLGAGNAVDIYISEQASEQPRAGPTYRPSPGGGGYSTLSWVRMCGPKFRTPPYNKTREDANLLPISKPIRFFKGPF